jgi:hypothetical protein
MEISVKKPNSVTVRISNGEDEFYGPDSVEMLIPESFPDKALAAVAFLRESDLDVVLKGDAFDTLFIWDNGESEVADHCEAIIQACGNIWVYFDEDGDTKCYLGTAQDFADRVRQALTEAQPAAAPKMGV